MTLKEKYHLVNMAALPFSETLALSTELAVDAEHPCWFGFAIRIIYQKDLQSAFNISIS